VKFYMLAMCLFSAILMCLGGSAFAAGKGSNPNGKPFIELQGAIVEVEGEISSLSDQVDSLVDRVDTIEGRIGVNEDAIALLQQQNADLETLIVTYGTDLLALQTEVQDLEAQNAALQAQVAAGDSALQAQIDENEALITSLQQTINEITSLQDEIDNNTQLILAMQDEVAAINALLVLKQNVVDGICPAGQSIREIQSDGSVVCEIDDVASGGATGFSLRRVTAKTPIAPGEDISLDAACPAGYALTGGGFSSYPSGIAYQSGPTILMGDVTADNPYNRA